MFFLVVFGCSLLCCGFTSEWAGFSLFLIKNFFLNHQDCILFVRILLLEYSHEVVSTSSVYFVKLVLDVRRPKLFHFGGKKGRRRRAMQA